MTEERRARFGVRRSGQTGDQHPGGVGVPGPAATTAPAVSDPATASAVVTHAPTPVAAPTVAAAARAAGVADQTGDDPGWVAVVRTADRSGTVTQLAGVFSTRGVNVDSIATGVPGVGTADITLTFRASERRCRQLVRSVERLAPVREVVVRSEDDPRVHAAAVIIMAPGEEFIPDPSLVLRWSGETALGEPLLAEGPYDSVRRLVSAASGRALTMGVVLSAF